MHTVRFYCQNHSNYTGVPMVYWLRCCTENREVAGSIPNLMYHWEAQPVVKFSNVILQ